jgi:sugar phosphate isomerase/epimerase
MCVGSTFATNLYAKYEEGIYTSFPTAEDFADVISWSSSQGFSAVEIEVLNAKHLRSFDRRSVKVLAEAQVELGTVVPHISFPFVFRTFPEDGTWGRIREDFERCVEVASDIGAKVVQLTSPPFPWTELNWVSPYPGGPPSSVTFHRKGRWQDVWQVFASRVGELCDAAGKRKLKVALEPRIREILCNSDAMLKLLSDVQSPALGVLFDTGHFFLAGEILPVSVWKLGPSIMSVQLSDNDGLIEHHWAPGEGKIDWQEFLSALKQEGYTGYLAVESSGVGRTEAEILGAQSYLKGIMERI